MELHLSTDEQALLGELLLDAQRRLFLEISKADHLEFRQMLRKRESLLESLLSQLAAVEVHQPRTAAGQERFEPWRAEH